MKPSYHHVAATPAERFVLALVLFQRDPETQQPVLRVRNGLEGRMLRSFVRALALEPIRKAMDNGGAVVAKLAQASGPEQLRRFTLPSEVVQYFREHIADLPRTAGQECMVGELMDALHGVNPVDPAHPDFDGNFEGQPEQWAPAPAPAEVAPETSVRAVVEGLQGLIDELEAALEPLPEYSAVAPHLAAFFEKLSARLEVADG